MNQFLEWSIELANQGNYLDELFKVYPTIPNELRDINPYKWEKIRDSFNERNNADLISRLLKLELFPIKDSYVGFLKADKNAISRNPQTINRLAGELYQMGLSKLYESCSQPKETNRQIGPMFRKWIRSGSLGILPVAYNEFISNNENAILAGTDTELKEFAQTHLNYSRDKGLDLVARFGGKYVIGEAKFLTAFGGHQTTQFNDALDTIYCVANAQKIAILDGVCYIKGKNKMYRNLTEKNSEFNIMSALALRNFLYSL